MELPAPETEDAVTQKNLREQVRELTALRQAARLLQSSLPREGAPLQDVVALLPAALQHPELAAARIRLGAKEYATAEFRETPWMLRFEFRTGKGEPGSIFVAYLAEPPACAEGPFLPEEEELVESLAEMLRSHFDRQVADQAQQEVRAALEAEVLARTGDLRRLASRLTLAEERERRRIASGLHDQIGQALAVIRIRMREFQGNAVFAGFETEIGEILRLLDQTIRFTRTLTGEISSPILYELGLAPALDWLAEHFTERHRFSVSFRSSGATRRLPEELAVMLFTSARELLFNSLKYSGEAGAGLELRWGEKELTLTVHDDGNGFDPASPLKPGADAFGLFSIRERMGDLGGTMEIASSPGDGCRVTIVVPVPEGRND